MPKTLLLADDSVTIQKVVGITFASEDVDLVTVDNGDAALVRAREITPDLVLADVSMPGMNGYELCAAIKSDPALAHIPVILLTGTFESYDEQKTQQAGADGYIAKPFEAQALVDLVQATLERAAAAKAAAPVPEVPAEPTAADFARPVGGPEPIPAPPMPEVPPAPPAPQSSGETTFSFADPEPAGSGTGSAEATQLFDPSAVAVDPAGPLLSAAPTAPDAAASDPEPPEIDAVLYEETSFLDPRAALTGEGPAAPTVAPQDGEPLPAPEFEPLGVPGDGSDSDVFGEHSGPATTLLAEDETAPRMQSDPELTALAAEEALDAVSGLEAAAQPPAPADETQPAPAERPAPQHPAAAVAPPAPVPAPPAAAVPQRATAVGIDPSALHDVIEKVAWEAFGPLSEQLVAQVVKKIEEITWEVVPQLAERLIRDEIERLKGESSD